MIAMIASKARGMRWPLYGFGTLNPMTNQKKSASGGHFDDFPLADADTCVKCGLCLPHCPTYGLSQEEGDSPRGRIALMQGLAQGVIAAEGRTLEHLDGCLTCRACETVCPAQVPYGRLIDEIRKDLHGAGHRPGPGMRVLAWWRRTPRRLEWLARSLRLLRFSGLAKIAGLLPISALQRRTRLLAGAMKHPAAGEYAPPGESRGRVGLFLGCIARPLDAAPAWAAIRVLNAMGFTVSIPAQQGCCGAIDQHSGDAAAADSLRQQNERAFDESLQAIITTASGCGVQLKETMRGAPVHDIMAFIAMHRNALPAFREGGARITVHAPCTLKNGMKESGAAEVLAGIPGLHVSHLAHQHCCGSAGSYMLEHPQDADRLGNNLLQAVPADTDILASSNVGCALHLRNLSGSDFRIIHPVVLLAEHLPPGSSKAL